MGCSRVLWNPGMTCHPVQTNKDSFSGTMNVPRFHVNPSSSYRDISVWTETVDQQTGLKKTTIAYYDVCMFFFFFVVCFFITHLVLFFGLCWLEMGLIICHCTSNQKVEISMLSYLFHSWESHYESVAN